MAVEYYANNASSTLSGSITSGSLTLFVASANPFPPSPQYRLQIQSEYLIVDGATGSMLLVRRGMEGSTAVAHASGEAVIHVLTSGSLVALATKTNPFPLGDEIALSQLVWVNQGAASGFQSGPGIVIRGPAATVNLRCLVKALPAASGYTLICPMWFIGPSATVACAGLVLRESGTGKLTTIATLENGTLEIQKWTDPTTFSALYATDASPNWHNYGKPLYQRLQDNGTSRTYSVSQEGTHWKVLHSVGRTDFLTPDQYGFFLNVEGSGNDRLATFFSATITIP